ncbi:MAG: phosphoadenylyl-sulfate reductase [Bacteroidales bacterium]|jgi:phosphoadenosine phosphosulfate reductase|nr:phosphoadenylyl-sulfate reductase [Bacteroidales bacterium]
MYSKSDTERLNIQFADASAEELLSHFLQIYGKKIALSSSLGMEDQVLTAMLVGIEPDARIFTLDTGRLFPETYQLIHKTNSKYNIRIEVFFPDYTQVETMVNQEGINLFYETVEKRKRCCRVRKTEPLKRAFQGLEAWICGLRNQQSPTRKNTRLIEWDEMNNLLKINPLVEWSEEQLKQYIQTKHVPYNKLHDAGFPSIGCEPCTRAVEEGEDIRAGRWWWESPEHKECGLHRR